LPRSAVALRYRNPTNRFAAAWHEHCPQATHPLKKELTQSGSLPDNRALCQADIPPPCHQI
jgi:hypothetical protein